MPVYCPDVAGTVSGCFRFCRPDVPEYAPPLIIYFKYIFCNASYSDKIKKQELHIKVHTAKNPLVTRVLSLIFGSSGIRISGSIGSFTTDILLGQKLKK